MRIRKHAKLHGLTFCNNLPHGESLSPLPPPTPFLQSHICHLNQSPWDVVVFTPDSPSSPYQVNGDDSNASFGDSTGAVESVASMKISVGEEKSIDGKKEVPPWLPFREDSGEGRGNGKRWQCSKEAVAAAKKPPNPAAGENSGAARRRPRAKQASRIPETNPYDFYYYSGFGPRWGKKRGSRAEPGNGNGNEKGKSVRALEDDRGDDSPPASPLPGRIDSGQLDYVELEDEDDEEEEVDERESGGGGKKRVRKPIKARSLKSLM